MKIIDLKANLLYIPMGKPKVNRRDAQAHKKYWLYVLVKVFTDDGTVGIGGQGAKNECEAANIIRSISEITKPFLIRQIVEPFYVGKLVAVNRSTAPSRTRFPSSVEMALWDIIGKVAGQPIYKILGACQDEVKAYATIPGYEYPDWKAERWVEMATKIFEDGFRAIKLEMSTGKGIADVKRDIRIVGAVRNTLGNGVDIMFDANSAWVANPYSFRTALGLARGLEKFDVVWLEEPVHHLVNPEVSAKLAAAVDIQIAGGAQITYSHHFRTLLEKRALDVVQPNVENIGGISETRNVAILAENYGQVCVCHSFGPGLLLPATLQIVGSTYIPYVECCYHPPVVTHEIRDSILMEHLQMEKNGFLKIPKKPGLGVELNEETISAYARKGHKSLS